MVQAFSFESYQLFHGTFSEEHLRVTASTKYPFVRWVELKMLLPT